MEQQEQFVLEYFQHQHGLTFVDVGAYDGIIASTTNNLEKLYHWRGICVEPNPRAFSKLASSRTAHCYNCGLASQNGEFPFLLIDGYSEMLSGFVNSYVPQHKERVDREVQERQQTTQQLMIRTSRLEDILALHQDFTTIYYLSIDTEGSELDILHGIDLSRDIRLIGIEDNYNEGRTTAYLEENGYRFLKRVCIDNFFVKN